MCELQKHVTHTPEASVTMSVVKQSTKVALSMIFARSRGLLCSLIGREDQTKHATWPWKNYLATRLPTAPCIPFVSVLSGTKSSHDGHESSWAEKEFHCLKGTLDLIRCFVAVLRHAILQLGIPEIWRFPSWKSAMVQPLTRHSAYVASLCSVPWSIININILVLLFLTIFLLLALVLLLLLLILVILIFFSFFYFLLLLVRKSLSEADSDSSSCMWMASSFNPASIHSWSGPTTHFSLHWSESSGKLLRTLCQGLHVDSWKVFRHLEELWAACLKHSEAEAKIPWSTHQRPHGNCEILGSSPLSIRCDQSQGTDLAATGSCPRSLEDWPPHLSQTKNLALSPEQKSQHLVISGESNNEPSPHSPEMGGIK